MAHVCESRIQCAAQRENCSGISWHKGENAQAFTKYLKKKKKPKTSKCTSLANLMRIDWNSKLQATKFSMKTSFTDTLAVQE